MKTFNIITLLLIILGGINWLLIGVFQFDLIASVFGGQAGMLSRIAYVLVGLSALYQIMPWIRTFSSDEVFAERH